MFVDERARVFHQHLVSHAPEAPERALQAQQPGGLPLVQAQPHVATPAVAQLGQEQVGAHERLDHAHLGATEAHL